LAAHPNERCIALVGDYQETVIAHRAFRARSNSRARASPPGDVVMDPHADDP